MGIAQAKENQFTPPTWLVIGLAGCIIALEAVVFLFPSPVEFPMDDAYIHFVYADNLISHGRLFFSDVNETGVGATSPLWVFLLAGLKLLGIPLPVSAKIMGAIGLVVVSGTIYVLFRPVWNSPFLLLSVFLITISGNLVWFSLSGMETVLFVALGLLSLVAYRRERWKTLGVLFGLMILTRPEGLVLAGATVLVDLRRNRRLRREWSTPLLISIVMAAPWFIYLYMRTGYVLPSSAIGKRFTFTVGLDFIASQYPYLAGLVQLRPLVYPFAWLAYLLVFALGGKSLPPPFVSRGDYSFGIYSYAPSYWAIAGWLLVIIPLLLLAGRHLLGGKKWRPWIHDSNHAPLMVFTVWILLHNLAYMFFMPILGTASRYGVMNHVALWIFLCIGAAQLSQRIPLQRFMTAGLVLIALANTFYWNRVYDANIEHMQKVRIPTADFVRESFSRNELCAVFDIGAVRYFSGRPILDIGGLTNPDDLHWFSENKSDIYLLEKGATCIILPGQTSMQGEGWLDFVEVFGLGNTRYFKLEKSASFEMNSERWLLGYLPTTNQQRSVIIYRIVRTDRAFP